MKATRSLTRQSGFFAAGIALVLLAVFGATGATAVAVLDEGPQPAQTADLRSASAQAPADDNAH